MKASAALGTVFFPVVRKASCRRSVWRDSKFALDETLEKVDYGLKGMYTFRANSFSSHGTCRADPYEAVVAPTGQVYGTAGLFVADASLIPAPMTAPIQWCRPRPVRQ